MEKIIEEIIDLVNEQRDSQGQISLDKLKTDIGILIIEQSKVNNGVLDDVIVSDEGCPICYKKTIEEIDNCGICGDE